MARAGSPDCHVDLHGETFQSGSSYPRHAKGMLDMGPAEALQYRALPRDYSHSIFNSFFNLKLNPPSRWLFLLIRPFRICRSLTLLLAAAACGRLLRIGGHAPPRHARKSANHFLVQIPSMPDSKHNQLPSS